MKKRPLLLALLLTAIPLAAQKVEALPLTIKFDITGQGENRRGGMVPVDRSAYSPKFIASRECLTLDHPGATGALHWNARLTWAWLGIHS